MALFRELGLFNLLLGAGILTFFLAILLAFGIVSWITRPLHKLVGATEAISQGDYEQRVPLEGPEEVQRVAVSFNSMAAQVATTRQAQRDFVANVSHDLKTPITSIQGWSQALQDGTAVSPDSQQRAASIIHNEAERMSRMVRQLLDLAKIESGQLELHKESVDLCQIVTDVHHSLLPRANAQQIHLTVHTEGVPPILGDADRLMQVFTNLVDNALTHTLAGGRVHLDVHAHGDKAIEVVVQDTGKGIAPDELARIFERFYTDRPHENFGQNSGLGLNISRQIVTAHGGRLYAENRPQDGASDGSGIRTERSAGARFVIRLAAA